MRGRKNWQKKKESNPICESCGREKESTRGQDEGRNSFCRFGNYGTSGEDE